MPLAPEGEEEALARGGRGGGTSGGSGSGGGGTLPCPPVQLLQGLSLFLQACVDADLEILHLEKTLQTLTTTLFNYVVAIGPPESPTAQSADAVRCQGEVLRCLEVLAESYQLVTLEFVLCKAKPGNSREERLGALQVRGTAGAGG